MKRLSFFIARRYTTGTPQDRSLATMARVCFWSIILGSFALALVMAVMNGFEKATHEKMQGINADSTLHTFEGEFDLDTLAPILDNPFFCIAHWAPSATGHALATRTNNLDLNTLVIIKGIDPTKERAVSSLAQTLLAPQKADFAQLVHSNYVLIGTSLARQHALHIGDTLHLFVADEAHSGATKLALEKEKTIVAGIFQTGIDDFDANVVVCDLSFLQQIDSNARIDTISLKHAPGTREKNVLQKLKKQFDDVSVSSWKELYPALVDALRLEKYAMFLILALIMLVACSNIIALLFMHILQKRGDIAVLRSLGMAPRAIRSIFITLGMGLSTTASLIGLVFATATSFALDHFKLISLPDAYYVDYLPARMEPQLLMLVFAVITLMSFGATWFATKKIASLNISHILRFEA